MIIGRYWPGRPNQTFVTICPCRNAIYASIPPPGDVTETRCRCGILNLLYGKSIPGLDAAIEFVDG